jgi:hypothetical protein
LRVGESLVIAAPARNLPRRARIGLEQARAAAYGRCVGQRCLDAATFAEVLGRTLDTERAALAQDHLDSCAACRRHLSELARDVQGFASTQSVTSPHAAESGYVGTRIGRYVVIEVAGAGGMGIVFRAHDPMLGREVAIKLVMHQGPRTDQRARHLREARALALVDHPNVIPIYDVGEAGDAVYIVMPYLAGGTLRDRLAEVHDPDRILELFVAAGRGLAAAHAVNIVHRDFKPSNVLVTASGALRVADFGISRSDGRAVELDPVGDPDPAVTAALAGTLRYMAPEQLSSQAVDASCDQFAFAVALWEALHGRHPFLDAPLPPPTPSEQLARIAAGPIASPDSRTPAAVDAALRRALSPASADRWPSMDALLDALVPLMHRRARRRWLALGGAALAVLGASIVAAAIASRDDAPVAAPVCGARARIAEIWNPAVRARYLTDARSRSSGDAGWLDWYARALELEYTAWCGRAEPQRITCLDEAVGDLRTAVARDQRQYWPRLRALDRCGARRQPRTIGALLNAEYSLLSPTGDRIAQHLPPTHLPIVRPLGSSEGRTIELAKMFRWLADGTIAGRTKGGELVAIDPTQRRPVRRIASLARDEVISPNLRYRTDTTSDRLGVVPVGGGAAIMTPIVLDPLLGPVADFSPDERRFANTLPGGDVTIDDLATGRRDRFACRLHLRGTGETALRWLDPTSFLITGSATAHTASDLWRIKVDRDGGLAEPPLVYERAEDATALLVMDAQPGKQLVSRTQLGARLLYFNGDRVTEMPGATARLVPHRGDARGRVLTSGGGVWGWLSLDDATTQPLPNLGRSMVATVGPTGIAAVDHRSDPPVFLDLDESGAIRSRTPIDAARGARPQLRCGAERCVLRWFTGATVALVEVHGTAIGPVTSHSLPQLVHPRSHWDLSPDGRWIAITGIEPFSEVVLYDRVTRRDRRIDLRCAAQYTMFASAKELVAACYVVDDHDAPFRLLRVDIDSGRQRELSRGLDYISSLAPVGDRVLFSTVTYRVELLLFE